MNKKIIKELILTEKNVNDDEEYYGIQSFSDPSEAWEVMRGEWDESAPDQERDIIILDDDTFPKIIKRRAIIMAASYLMGTFDKDVHDRALLVSNTVSDYLVDFNFFYWSSFSRKFYTSRMEFKDDHVNLWSNRQWDIFKELSAILDFKGICKDAIRVAKELKKELGGNITDDDIAEYIQDEELYV